MPLGRPITLTDNVASKILGATATAGQTVFTITGGYRINAIAVYRNGARLKEEQDYQARDGSTVILLSAASLDDALEFQIFDDFRISDAITSAQESQTISGDLTVAGKLTGLQNDASNVNVTGIVTAAGGIDAIGISSAGTSIHTGTIQTLNFVGTGNTFKVSGNTVDISISGGGGGASKVYDSTVYAYDNVLDSDITIESPYKTASIWTNPDVTVDVEAGVTVSVDEGCSLNIIDI